MNNQELTNALSVNACAVSVELAVEALKESAHSMGVLKWGALGNGNDQAFEFYERFGFEKGEVVKNYYKRIEPPDAVILRRDLGASWTERELEGVTFDEDAA